MMLEKNKLNVIFVDNSWIPLTIVKNLVRTILHMSHCDLEFKAIKLSQLKNYPFTNELILVDPALSLDNWFIRNFIPSHLKVAKFDPVTLQTFK